MKSFNLNISIEPEEFILFYSGQAKTVVARSDRNEVVEFPANILRKFVSNAGITGRFVIYTNDDNKFIAIERLL